MVVSSLGHVEFSVPVGYPCGEVIHEFGREMGLETEAEVLVVSLDEGPGSQMRNRARSLGQGSEENKHLKRHLRRIS